MLLGLRCSPLLDEQSRWRSGCPRRAMADAPVSNRDAAATVYPICELLAPLLVGATRPTTTIILDPPLRLLSCSVVATLRPGSRPCALVRPGEAKGIGRNRQLGALSLDPDPMGCVDMEPPRVRGSHRARVSRSDRLSRRQQQGRRCRFDRRSGGRRGARSDGTTAHSNRLRLRGQASSSSILCSLLFDLRPLGR
jgi:hypothetical protein